LEPLFLRVNDGTNVKQNSVYIGKLQNWWFLYG